MFFRLLLLFTLVPVIELTLLIQIGKATSVQFTIALILLTGLIGASLARWQGRIAIGQLQSDIAAGRPPAAAAVNGILILIAGAVLLTPGLLTDLFGFSLLIPQVRNWMRGYVVTWLTRRVKVQTQAFGNMHRAGAGRASVHPTEPPQTTPGHVSGDDIIDVEFERVDECDTR